MRSSGIGQEREDAKLLEVTGENCGAAGEVQTYSIRLKRKV